MENIDKCKKCSKCGEVKSVGEFIKDKYKKDGYTTQCKSCRNKNYWDNKDRIDKQHREYYEENKVVRGVQIAKYRQKNVEKFKTYRIDYYLNNKEKEKEQTKRNKRKRYLNGDVCFKLRSSVSNKVNCVLKGQFSSKKGSSILKHLPYTIQGLKQHLESQFESWMNWENYGKANRNKRTWNIDHIIPQSKLLYDSMQHENFKKCWSLENLRPLGAIENIKKGNRDGFYNYKK
ncbi:MAG: hypothetical protein Q8P81_02280 [Nanoarchaeota archaeon]|nr:hypothetical protein [Nanoarchaeota archaeon]